MSKNSRQSQHRPERESAKGRELAESKKQIKQLKKLVGRQQKQIRKLQDLLGMDESPEIEETPVTLADSEPVPAPEFRCPKCASDQITQFPAPNGVIAICKGCLNRWKLDSL